MQYDVNVHSVYECSTCRVEGGGRRGREEKMEVKGGREKQVEQRERSGGRDGEGREEKEAIEERKG